MKKLITFLFLFLPLSLNPALAQGSDVYSQLATIQANLCSDETLNKSPTEGQAPCIHCADTNTKENTEVQYLKGITQKVISEDSQQTANQRELAFYLLARDRGLIYTTQDENASGATYEQLVQTHDLYKKSVEEFKIQKKSKKHLAAPNLVSDLNKALETGEISSATKEVLLKEWDEKKKFIAPDSSHQEKLIKAYQTEIEVQKDKLKSDPTNEHIYNYKLKMYTAALNQIYENHDNLVKKIEWLKNGGSKSDANSNLWESIAIDISSTISNTQNAKYQIESINQTIQNYEHEITKLKASIDQKKEVKHGPIHTDSTKDDLEKFRKIAKKLANNFSNNPGYRACGMTDAEILAIRWYTGSHYGWINSALRGDESKAATVKPFVEVLNSALKKLKAFDGEVKRGTTLPQVVADQHTAGNIVNYPAFTSSSIGNGFGGTHKFVIKSKKGRYVGSHSSHYNEHEVLFAADTKFKIISNEQDSGVSKIVMEEVGE